jgi:hypothetical protein
MADWINVHGARLRVPQEWEDVSIYRFLPPAEEEAVMRAKKPRRAQPNLVVTRHARIDDDPPAKFFAVMNDQIRAENASFRVIGSGEGDYIGQPAAWQDSTQTAESLAVHQRHVLVPGWEGELVLITMTGDKKQIAAMSAAIELTVAAQSG